MSPTSTPLLGQLRGTPTASNGVVSFMVATQSGDVSVLALPANDGDRRRADRGAVTGAPLSLIRIEANGTLAAVSVSSGIPVTSRCPFVVSAASGNARGSVAAVLASNFTIHGEVDLLPPIFPTARA